ncbi:DUF2797 domain-containing protein [Salinirubellus salinus]|uniref:DUF2797 domain-containing protein n=1 Tax=Salinirubellus salinus TaxID=1364945 RepID=A0A9E7R3W5_9EURY|nr:DUF2797 domain-containing protein [Salinirubellus salinus]UWM55356.1 DUF2797 domain-containing protein [Salinirubellus salinus]
MQVVGYEPSPDAAVVLADGGRLERVGLAPGTTLAYTLGERHCAGTVQGEHHVACERSTAPYCSVHERPHYDPATSDEEHAVYLAAFAPHLFKVGITKTRRLETRLREQGADRGAHVYTVTDGEVALQVEDDVYADPRLTQWVQVSQKVPGLHRTVDERAWTALLDDFTVHESFGFDYGLSLTDQPVPETLLTGTVSGVQGRVLVLERAGTVYAVDLRDLLGYELTDGEEDRELQSSLGAWG